MEGADTFIKLIPPEKPIIPQGLVDATYDSIKAGIRLDEQVIEAQAKKEAEKEAALKLEKSKKSKDRLPKRHVHFANTESNEDFEERTYRAHEDRRFGFLIIGEQHRFVGNKKEKKDENEFFYEPPLDYSFCLLNTYEEIVAEGEIPQSRRNYKACKKTEDGRYITASLRLSYNVLKNFEGFINILYKLLDAGPFGLRWLDMSFNSISTFDEDTISQLPNLKIFYLHGNALADMTEITKLKLLPALEHLTLHGNPIEQDEAYRISILYYLPNLKHLDFIGVTKGDHATSKKFGIQYERHWEKKHLEIRAMAQSAIDNKEMSLTERLLLEAQENDNDSD